MVIEEGDFVNLASNYQTFVIDENSDLRSFGSDDWGSGRAIVTPIEFGEPNDWERISTNIFMKNSWPSYNTGTGLYSSTLLYADLLNRHNLGLKPDGSLWAWGNNQYGQLGNGSFLNYPLAQTSPLRIGSPSDVWTMVSAGGAHSLAIKDDGTLWSWGLNDFGQLGNDSTETSNVPVLIGTAMDQWSFVSAGDTHSFAIKTDGSLWAWGDNTSGRLGDGTTTNRLIPVRIADGTNDWKSVRTAIDHTVAVKTDGSLWSWGVNFRGKLGLGQFSTALPAVNSPTRIGTLNVWKTAAVANDFSLAVREDGSLWAWGRGFRGRLGQGSSNTSDQASPVRIGNLNDWNDIAPGDNYSVALKTDGTVWTWGENYFGQLSDGTNTVRFTPTQIATNIRSISARQTTVLIDNSDQTYIRGYNDFGGLGLGDEFYKVKDHSDWLQVYTGHAETTFLTTFVKEEFHLGLKRDGSLWQWGQRFSYNGNNYVTLPAILKPTRIGNDNKWRSIAKFRLAQYLAIAKDGTLWVWGDATTAYLGIGTDGLGAEFYLPDPVKINDEKDWKVAAVGDHYFLALKTDGTLWTWGENLSVTGGFTNPNDGRIFTNVPARLGLDNDWKSIEAGPQISYAIKNDGSLWGWNADSNWQIGLGGERDYISIIQPTRIGQDNDWKMVSTFDAGEEPWTLAVKTDGSLWVWGGNPDGYFYGYSGHIGLGENVEFTSEPTRIGTDNDWIFAHAGGSYSYTTPVSMAVKSDGSLYVWGNNYLLSLVIDGTLSMDKSLPYSAQENAIYEPRLIQGYKVRTSFPSIDLDANFETQIVSEFSAASAAIMNGAIDLDAQTGAIINANLEIFLDANVDSDEEIYTPTIARASALPNLEASVELQIETKLDLADEIDLLPDP
jgi:alpha-tubulin suppressor-like RCC1 family protein